MVSRREFMGWLAGMIPAAAIVRRAHAASIAYLAAAPETLDALGVAILPAELGAAQIGRVVAGFRRWSDGYRENAELNHAYGNSRLRFTGPTAATRWTKQLDDLDAAARAAHGVSFAALTVAQRQDLVRPALAVERGIPSSPDGATHVALALLGFFYGSPLATDLCYEATIGKNTCRPLSESSRRPLPRSRSASGRVLTVGADIEAGS
jgi:Gluconate 2-dehydrogenase subunit 3